MNRLRASYLGKSRESSSSSTEKDANDLESTASTVVREEPLKPPALKMKRVDWYYSRWSKSWKYRVSLLRCYANNKTHCVEHELKSCGRSRTYHQDWR
jgi:hypothetical protein